MKFVKFGFITALFISFVYASVPLNDNWLFNIGNDSSWAGVDLNDSNWYSIEVPGSWESQGFANYDGIAWYRCQFHLDSCYLEFDTLFLYLGRTNDAVFPYINGIALLDSISSVDSLKGGIFKIPSGLCRENNVLAVQIDNRAGEGGLLEGPLLIASAPIMLEKKPEQPVAHRSWNILPFGNGISTATYDVQHRSFGDLRPHIYNDFNGNEKTGAVAASARTVLFKDRREIDLGEMESVSCGYINGTGIIHHKLRNKNCVLDQYAFSPMTKNQAFWVFYTVISGDSIDKYSLNFELDGIAPGLNVGKWSFQENGRKWLFVVCDYDKTLNQKAYTIIRKFKNEHPGFTALINEINWWKGWQKNTLLPQNISDTARAVYLQSIALIKMAQSREKFPARGQIVATFPPNDNAVATVSGMSFSIDALLKSGHFEEALAALQFIMNSNCGSLKHYSWAGEKRGIGQDYTVSVNYYYGNGSEATKTGEFGPEFYLGNLGLVLWNLKQYVEITNDFRFLEYYWPKISSEIADVIISNIDDTGVLKVDHGFYNHGAPKHYFYTSACGYRGLVDAVWLARMINDENRARAYETKAVALQKAIETSFLDDDGSVKAFIEDGENNLDAITALGLRWVFTSPDIGGKSTLELFKKELVCNNGFTRHPPKGLQPGNEWTVGNIMIAKLYSYMIHFKESADLIKWVGDQAFYNYCLIPEYYSADKSNYTGDVPLCGFGAGIYISSLWGE